MTTRPQSHLIARHSPAQRHQRPSVQRAVLRYQVLEAALLEAFAEYDGLAPHSAEWCELLGRIKAISNELTTLNWWLLGQVGHNVALWKKLKQGVV